MQSSRCNAYQLKFTGQFRLKPNLHVVFISKLREIISVVLGRNGARSEFTQAVCARYKIFSIISDKKNIVGKTGHFNTFPMKNRFDIL